LEATIKEEKMAFTTKDTKSTKCFAWFKVPGSRFKAAGADFER
jgi:hypothetical protein